MRIVVTGGAGFIGSHVVDLCLAAGHEVAVVDDLSTGKRENLPRDVRLEVVDLRDRERIFRTVAELRPNAICHQAAQASVVVSVREPLRDADVNVIGTINLLHACQAIGVDRFVFASSGGTIYGELADGVRASEDSRLDPKSPYGFGKLYVEQLLGVHADAHGFDAVVLRYANVYGPRQDANGECGVVATFVDRTRRGQALIVNARRASGDDGCVRDYVYVGDVARANLAALERKIATRVLNVGTGIGTSTRELAVRVFEACGRETGLEFAAPRAGDFERNVLDPTACERALGGFVDLKSGLDLTLKSGQSSA